MITNVQAVEAVSALFETFRPEYKGDCAGQDIKGQRTGYHTWFFEVWGDELCIVSDASFPYSRPNVFIVNYDFGRNLPHVEQSGRLCLTKIEFSTNPVEVARQVLAEALELLEAHQLGTEDSDLEEDLTNYWNQRADAGSPALYLLYQDGASKGSYSRVGNEVFAFSSKQAMLHWWENLKGAAPRHTNAAHFIEIRKIPNPSSFPTDPSSLLRMLKTHAVDAAEIMLQALRQFPNETLLILAASTPSDRRQFMGIRLLKTEPLQKNGFRREARLKHSSGGSVEVDDLLARYTIQRLSTSHLDASASRSVISLTNLVDKQVVVVGCGAVGAGVARLLCKSGVGRLDLVDSETLGWENIRRHELGARSVRQPKAKALAADIRQDLPEMVEVRAFSRTIQDLVLSGSNVLEGADLIVATTGSFHADNYIGELAREGTRPIPVVFGWMEAWGVAGHALLLSGAGSRFIDGFKDGTPLRPSSRNDRPPPKECGNSTTPFGAAEVAAVQAMIVDLCVDRLLEPGLGDTWRTWWTTDRSLARAGGHWTEEFQAVKPIVAMSGVMERLWP